MTSKTTKAMTHQQLINKMLKNSTVIAELNKLNRKEFAILDEILKTRKGAELSQAQIAKPRDQSSSDR